MAKPWPALRCFKASLCEGLSSPNTPQSRESIKQVLIVRKPEGFYASMTPAMAGEIGCCGGINEKGISVGLDASQTYEYTDYSCICVFVLSMILDKIDSLHEAVDYYCEYSQGAINVIISDGKLPDACVIEKTENLYYVGTWDHHVENLPPFWQIDHVIRRKNFFIHPLLALMQRFFYNPTWFRIILGIMGLSYYSEFRVYRALSNQIEKNWSTLTLNNTIQMWRSVYSGETDLFLKLRAGKWPWYNNYHQWASCPKTGEMVISFAENETSAHKNTVHYFRLNDLVNASPP